MPGMRERRLLHVFLAFNLVVGGGLLTYAFLPQPAGENESTTHFIPERHTPREPLSSSVVMIERSADSVAAVTMSTNTVALPSFAGGGAIRRYTWREVDSASYQNYLQSLRLAGCPEAKIESIALSDIDELIAHQRMEAAVTHDPEWWRAAPNVLTAHALQTIGQALASERHSLIEKLLGERVAMLHASNAGLWHTVQLTGHELGSLSATAHLEVQEICRKAAERKDLYDGRPDIVPASPVELARLREQTRRELSEVMDAKTLQEFLLRYSQNANRLRDELRSFDPSADEFRRIFGAVDQIDHPMELEFGTVEALSPKQRERHETQRRAAVRAVLSPERYAAYLAAQPPLPRASQTSASR